MKIKKSFVVAFLILLINSSLFAQELVNGLSFNPVIAQQAQMWKNNIQKSTSETLKLPFFTDFSNYIGYPDPNIFLDRLGFVNNTFAIRPPSIGVVTLDALDENGAIYSHANASGFYADTLTSNYIRLDSIFTSNRPI